MWAKRIQTIIMALQHQGSVTTKEQSDVLGLCCCMGTRWWLWGVQNFLSPSSGHLGRTWESSPDLCPGDTVELDLVGGVSGVTEELRVWVWDNWPRHLSVIWVCEWRKDSLLVSHPLNTCAKWKSWPLESWDEESWSCLSPGPELRRADPAHAWLVQ